MLGIHDYWLFVLTGVLLNLTPGQDTLFFLGRSLTSGNPRVRTAIDRVTGGLFIVLGIRLATDR